MVQQTRTPSISQDEDESDQLTDIEDEKEPKCRRSQQGPPQSNSMTETNKRLADKRDQQIREEAAKRPRFDEAVPSMTKSYIGIQRSQEPAPQDKNRDNPSKRVTFSAETSSNEQFKVTESDGGARVPDVHEEVGPAKKNPNPRFSSLRFNCDLSTANQSTPVKAASAASLGIVSQSDSSRANQSTPVKAVKPTPNNEPSTSSSSNGNQRKSSDVEAACDPVNDLESLAEAEVDFENLPPDMSQRIEDVLKSNNRVGFPVPKPGHLSVCSTTLKISDLSTPNKTPLGGLKHGTSSNMEIIERLRAKEIRKYQDKVAHSDIWTTFGDFGEVGSIKLDYGENGKKNGYIRMKYRSDAFTAKSSYKVSGFTQNLLLEIVPILTNKVLQ